MHFTATLLFSAVTACVALSPTTQTDARPHKLVRNARKANTDKIEALTIDADGTVDDPDGAAAFVDGSDSLVHDHAVNKAGEITSLESALQRRGGRVDMRHANWRQMEYYERIEYVRLCNTFYANNITGDDIKDVIMIAMETVTLTMPKFMAKPMLIFGAGNAMDIFREKLWEIVEKLVPKEVKDKPVFASGKVAWDAAFQTADDIKKAIEDFKKDANTVKLINDAVVPILVRALNVAEGFWPKGNHIFSALIGLLNDIANAWQEFAEQKWPEGTNTLYWGLRNCTDDLAPLKVRESKAYKWIIAALDATVGKMQDVVYAFKKAIMQSRICRRKSGYHRPPQAENEGFPNKCPDRYTYDAEDRSCFPPLSSGGPCIKECGKKGRCSAHCGPGLACCKRFDRDLANSRYGAEPCECVHAGMYEPAGEGGYVNNPATKGDPNDYMQCVAIGPCALTADGVCQNSASSLLEADNSTSLLELDASQDMDVTLEKKKKKKKPRPTAAPTPAPLPPYRAPSTCLDSRALLLEKKSKKKQNTAFNISSWIDALASDDAPQPMSLTKAQANEATFGSASLDVTLGGKGKSGGAPPVAPEDMWVLRPGTRAAECEHGEKVANKCYGDCKTGFKFGDQNSGKQWCMQDCSKTIGFPVSKVGKDGICGKTMADIDKIAVEFIKMFLNVVLKAVDLGLAIHADGFNPETDFSKIMDIIVEIAKPFLRPECLIEGVDKPDPNAIMLTNGERTLSLYDDQENWQQFDFTTEEEERANHWSTLSNEASPAAAYQKAAKVFQRFDLNMDGALSAEEIHMAAYTWKPEETELEHHIMEAVDADRDSIVSFPEFLSYLKKERVLPAGHEQDIPI